MQKTILSSLFVFSLMYSFSQLDYRQMKDTICPKMTYCGVRDSTSLSVIYPKLLAVDTTLLSYGIAEYYNDLAQVLTDLSIYNEADTSYRKLGLMYTEKYLYHDPNSPTMVWNAGFSYVALGDCDKAHYYLKRYGEVCPKKYLMKDQIAVFLEFCPSEELSKRFKIKPKTPK